MFGQSASLLLDSFPGRGVLGRFALLLKLLKLILLQTAGRLPLDDQFFHDGSGIAQDTQALEGGLFRRACLGLRLDGGLHARPDRGNPFLLGGFLRHQGFLLGLARRAVAAGAGAGAGFHISGHPSQVRLGSGAFGGIGFGQLGEIQLDGTDCLNRVLVLLLQALPVGPQRLGLVASRTDVFFSFALLPVGIAQAVPDIRDVRPTLFTREIIGPGEIRGGVFLEADRILSLGVETLVILNLNY